MLEAALPTGMFDFLSFQFIDHTLSVTGSTAKTCFLFLACRHQQFDLVQILLMSLGGCCR